MRLSGADCQVVATKRSNVRGAKGAGHPRHVESTGNRTNSAIWRKATAFIDGTSRMRRESHVRICEGLGAKLPGPTRLTYGSERARRCNSSAPLTHPVHWPAAMTENPYETRMCTSPAPAVFVRRLLLLRVITERSTHTKSLSNVITHTRFKSDAEHDRGRQH
jgi:hypothetical protein